MWRGGPKGGLRPGARHWTVDARAILRRKGDEVSAYPMDEDRVVGDGGGVTIYQRPDGSRYALDRRGRGHELCFGEGAMGPARFDARDRADGVWPGSRSQPGLRVGA